MSKLPLEVWAANYKYNNESFSNTWDRVAWDMAWVEHPHPEGARPLKDVFLSTLFTGNKPFMPGGRIIANAGTDYKNTTLINCTTMHPGDLEGIEDIDSIENIFNQVKMQAHILKSESGYGTNFSYLRPRGTIIEGVRVSTPGPVAFMEIWNTVSDVITRGGGVPILDKDKDRKDLKDKIRKGAMMGIISVWHPDIEDFIHAKQSKDYLTKFNTSVGVTAGFMEAVKADANWDLVFPDTTCKEYKSKWNGDIDTWKNLDLPIIVYKTVKARDIYENIMNASYTRNEPGIIFLDLVNKNNPAAYCETVHQTNPCGEVPMPTGVCDLGSINLPYFWSNSKKGFDFEGLEKTIPHMVRFLDNVLDATNYPLKELEIESKKFRRIGLGIMGLGSIGFMMGERYGSKKFLEFVDKLYKTITYAVYKASIELAKEKGAFSLFDADKHLNTPYWKNLPLPVIWKTELEEGIRKHGLRNSHLTMIAPTGNTGVLANITSGGAEPVFSKEYTRWIIVNDGEKSNLEYNGMRFPDPKKGEWFETKEFTFKARGDEEVLEGTFDGMRYEIDKNRGMVKAELVQDYGWRWVLDEIEPRVREKLNSEGVYAGAAELSVEEHLAPLIVIYRYLHLGISKTINIPSDYSYEQFKEVYETAYSNNIKGLTTYRAGTMTAVLETTEEEHDELEIRHNVKFPEKFPARGHLIKSENKKWYVILAFESDRKVKPIAVFTYTNSVEKTVITNETLELLKGFSKKYEFLQKYIDDLEGKSYHQTNIEKICRMLGLLLRHNIPLTEISEAIDDAGLPAGSFIFLLNKLLKSYIPNGTKIKQTCESCGEQMLLQEGCAVCPHCGLSLC